MALAWCSLWWIHLFSIQVCCVSLMIEIKSEVVKPSPVDAPDNTRHVSCLSMNFMLHKSTAESLNSSINSPSSISCLVISTLSTSTLFLWFWYKFKGNPYSQHFGPPLTTSPRCLRRYLQPKSRPQMEHLQRIFRKGLFLELQHRKRGSLMIVYHVRISLLRCWHGAYICA